MGTITDNAGNEITTVSIPSDQELKDNASLTVETVEPVVGSITTINGTGTYGVGATIPITLNFLNGSGGSAEALVLSGTGTINVGVNNPVVVNNGTATFSAVDGGAGTSVTGAQS